MKFSVRCSVLALSLPLFLAACGGEDSSSSSTIPLAPRVTVTSVKGGTGGNVVPDSCTVAVGRRIVPGEVNSEVAEQHDAAKIGRAHV